MSVAVERPAGTLVDGFGRRHTDLRLSVTDKCNLRCRYCMPAEGLPWLAQTHLLSAAEIVRIAGIAVDLGVRSIRLTGGEPLLRADLVDIVRGLARLSPRPELSMTTNGLRLAQHATTLAEGGLDRVNVSLDTLRPDRFRQLSRRNGLDQVLRGLAAAYDAGLRPVKVNAVLVRDVNDDEAQALLEFCLEHDYECRFIEQMPLDAGRVWDRTTMVTAAEVLDTLSRRWTLTPIPRADGAPAEMFRVDGGPVRVGIIGAVTRPFCRSCNRLRLTADGQVRNCLFAQDETDVRTSLHRGDDDAVIAAAMQSAVASKRGGHGIDDPRFVQPSRPMSAIGG